MHPVFITFAVPIFLVSDSQYALLRSTRLGKPSSLAASPILKSRAFTSPQQGRGWLAVSYLAFTVKEAGGGRLGWNCKEERLGVLPL